MAEVDFARTPITPRRAGTAAGLLAALTLAACSNTSSSGERVPSAEPSVSVSPRPLATDVYKAIGRVCDGFFAQTQPDGQVLLIGRPVVNEQQLPEDVSVGRAGIRLLPQRYGEGAVSWYTMRGAAIDEGETVSCHESPLYPRELTQPNYKKIWVATTDPDSAVPKTWDARALDPDGFGGVGLNYGVMSTVDMGHVLLQAEGN